MPQGISPDGRTPGTSPGTSHDTPRDDLGAESCDVVLASSIHLVCYVSSTRFISRDILEWVSAYLFIYSPIL